MRAGRSTKNGGDFGRDPEPGVDRAHCVEILGPALLDNIQPHAKTCIQLPDSRRHDVRHHAGALAAAKHQQVEFSVRRHGIGNPAGCDDLRPERIAGERYLALPVPIEVLERAKSGRDGRHPGREKRIRAAHDAVLLVQHRRYFAPACRQAAAGRSDSRRSRPRPWARCGRAASMPWRCRNASSVAVRASDIGSRPRNVALGMMCMARAGNL